MKKILLISILVLAIVASVVTGTLAIYNATLDEMTGDVVAKEFVFDQTKIENFDQTLKIAPTEEIKFKFSVTNTKNNVTSEVPMDITILISIGAKTGKSAIGNLEVIIYDRDGVQVQEVELTDGAGSVTILDYMGITEETKAYTIGVKWVENLVKPDSDYEGNDFGSTIKVLASAVQCTHTSHEVENADVEFEDISVRRSKDDAIEYLRKLSKKTSLSKYKSIFIDNGELVEGVYASDHHEYLDSYPSNSNQYAYFINNVKVGGGDEIVVVAAKSENIIVFMYDYYGNGFSIKAVSYSEDGSIDELYIY